MSEPWSVTAEPPAVQPPESSSSKLSQLRNLSGRQRLLAGIGALLVVMLVAGAVGFVLGRSSGENAAIEAAASSSSSAAAAKGARLKDAYARCEASDSSNTLELGDDGTTIVIDTHSQYGSTTAMNCVLSELNTPQSIEAQIGRTTAMMGVQDATHDGLQYSWSYHPKNGVNMVITDGS